MVSRNRDGRADILAVFRSHGKRREPLTTAEVADALDRSPSVAADRLEELLDDGALEAKTVGESERVWWEPGADLGTARSTTGEDGRAGAESGTSEDGNGDRRDGEGPDDSLERSTDNGDDTGVVLVDEGGDVAWIDRTAADRFDVNGPDVVGEDRDEFVRSVLAGRVGDEAAVEKVVEAPADGDEDGDAVAFEFRPDGGGRTVTVEHRHRSIDSGRYAGGRVEFFDAVDHWSVTSTPDADGNDRFRSLVEATEEYAIFMLDPDGHVISWNPGAERIKGYSEDEILGEHFSTFYTEEAVDAGVPKENLSRALEQGSAEDEGWRLRSDGTRFWGRITITPVRDDGELRGFAKVTRDMTDRREWEQRLQRERNLLERTLDAIPQSVGVVSRDGEFVRTNERASERLATADADADGNLLESREMYDENGDPVPAAERPHVRAFDTGQPVRDWHCRIDVPDSGHRWLSLSAVPITDDAGDVERVVVCSDDVTQLKAQANRLAARRDDLENELDDVFDRVSNAFLGLDDEWRFTYVNERAAAVLGREQEELVGASIWDTFEPAVGTAFEERYRAAMETQEPVHFEAYYAPLDQWFEVDAYPSETGLSVYFTDVTERKERERELERYERIVENVPAGVYRNTPGPDGRFVEGNAELASIFDADSVDELVGEPVSELYVDPKQRAEFSERLERDGVVEDYELRQETLDGRTIWISVTAIRVEEDGDVYFDGVVQDVTERKERERELERYETMFEESQDVNAIIDPDGTYSYLTPSTAHVLGYDPEDLVGENAFDYVHPDDRDQIWAEFRDVVADPEYSPLVELRFRHADGSWVVLEARARNFLDDPTINGVVAYTRDATERKLFEETLQALNESSRELIRAQGKSDVSRTVVDAATSVLDLPGVALYRHDEAADLLTLAEGAIEAGFMDEALPDFPVDHSSIVGHTYCEGEEQYFEDVTESDHLLARPDEVDMTAGLFVPLGEHGVLVVGWPGEDACDDRTRQLIEILAANAEAAYTRVERERELAASRQQYRSIVDNFPNGAIALVDRDLRYVTVGGSPRDLAGAPAAALEGEPVEEALEPALADELVPRYRRALDGEDCQFEREVDDRVYEFRIIPVRDESGEVFAATGMSQDVTAQVSHQRELAAKARQQEVVANLGQRALGADGLDTLLEDAVDLVTTTLNSEYCKVLDLDRDAEDLRLRAATGLAEEKIGSATVDVARETQAGYTLLADEPIVVEDMADEDRFAGPDRLMESDVESGISVVIGSRASPWGVLATHDTDSREFSSDDALFVQSVANILATAIERRDNEAALEDQREHLAALNNLNSVVRDINEALVDQSTREEIERTVCERLADSDSYRFAWIAEVDPRTESLDARVEAGVDGYVETADISVDEDSPEGRGPVGRAVRSNERHVVHDALSDPTFEPWRDVAREYGYRSVAAIPIVYQGTLYGILGVYTERVGAFADEEAEVVAQLGEIIGHAIASIDRKRALMSDDVVEIDIRMENVVREVGLDGSMDGEIRFTETVSVGEGSYLQYGTATDGALDTVESLVDLVPHWEDVTVLGDETEETDETRFELTLSGAPVISAVADEGGYIDEARITDDTMFMTIHLPPTVDVRRVVGTIQDTYPSAKMVKRRQVTRDDSQKRIERTLTEELTERQRAALEASFHAGFFDWPRESSGEEVAESLDVSAPTFHQHLRKAQQKLLESVLS